MDQRGERGKAVAVEIEYDSLDKLRVGSNSIIKVMVYRTWDVTNAYGRYRSTEYVLSDVEGNVIQCSARSNISHCFVSMLEVGKVVSIARFLVVANKDKYRIRNGDDYVLELEGYTTIKRLDCSSEGFMRFPFELIQLEDIHVNDSTYLIDMMGCPIDIRTIRTTRSASELLEFQLLNERGTCVRVTMWGSLCADFLKRAGHGNATYIVILPSMNIKEYRGEIYLSSTSATTLFDAINIPQIVDLYSILRENNTSDVHCLAPPPASRSVTIAQLLHMGRQQKETRKQTMAVHCSVRIESIRTKYTWFYYACGNNGCKRKLDREGPKFVCKTCKKDCDFPQTCYRLHVEAADANGSIVATFFDEVAEALLNKKAATLLCSDEAADDSDVVPREILSLVNTSHVFEFKTHTYFAHDSYTSFAVNKLVKSYSANEDTYVGIQRTRDEVGLAEQPPALKLGRSDEFSGVAGELGNEDNSVVTEDIVHGQMQGNDKDVVKTENGNLHL